MMHERLRPRVSRRPGDESGLTLVEMVVATALLGIVMLVFTNVLASVQRSVVEQDVRSRQNDDARLALQAIDRQVRSGNLLYDPDDESEPGYLFRIYTQANAPTFGQFRCSVWLIDDEDRLIERWWPANTPEDATNWRVAAEHVVNRVVGGGTPAFVRSPEGRTVNVTFLMNTDLEHHPEATQSFSASVTGRNTSYGYPVDVCADLPLDMP